MQNYRKAVKNMRREKMSVAFTCKPFLSLTLFHCCPCSAPVVNFIYTKTADTNYQQQTYYLTGQINIPEVQWMHHYTYLWFMFVGLSKSCLVTQQFAHVRLAKTHINVVF
ncbi:hypothetical protein ILYODFUR_022813 [Ilyodon furcidens]|uniref:Uncharacterized protein n=1 Tax=Ilyodon furcidens TaxID=33524 RepID=A0ABV0V5A7_9TELE